MIYMEYILYVIYKKKSGTINTYQVCMFAQKKTLRTRAQKVLRVYTKDTDQFTRQSESEETFESISNDRLLFHTRYLLIVHTGTGDSQGLSHFSFRYPGDSRGLSHFSFRYPRDSRGLSHFSFQYPRDARGLKSFQPPVP